MTTEKKTLTITMSERRPLKIDPELWPVIASASRHDGAVKAQANTEWYIKVREDEQGRRLVYGGKVSGNGGQYAGFRELRGGYLVDSVRDEAGAVASDEQGTVRAIRRVAGIIGDDQLGADCIGNLPAEEV
jgi:hypothetical protein